MRDLLFFACLFSALLLGPWPTLWVALLCIVVALVARVWRVA